MECWLFFASWWLRPVVIVTLRENYMLISGSFLHIAPFPGRGIMWHPQMISHSFLGLFFCCLYCNPGKTSPPRMVYVIGDVAPDSCNGTIYHGRQLDSLGNFPYPGGYCSSIRPKFRSIVHNQLTWVGTFPETSWCCYHNPPPLVVLF